MKRNRKRKAKLFKFLGFTKLPYLPFILGIEPGNICNLRCPLCPTGAGGTELKKGFMELGLFKHVFDQLKNDLIAVNLFNWGEPLLNKDFTKMVRCVKDHDKDISVTTSTNLNINNKATLEGLIRSGIDEIIVSCDGATKESYEKYRVGGDFGLVMDNLKFLIAENNKLSGKTRIIWNFLVFKHNEHEITQAQEMARKLGVELRLGAMRTSMKDEVLKPHKEAIKKDIGWIPDNPEYSAYDKVKLETKKKIKTCRKPWQELNLNWDGAVFPCCAIYGESYTFGNAKNELIRKIWNNEKYVAARRQILNKKVPAMSICGICRNNGFMHM